MSNSNKKQRRELKRKAKQRERRRTNSVSRIKRLADAPGEVDCWISEHFEEMGQRQIHVYKRGAGLSALACFLIDRGVVGLKDAFVQWNISAREVNDAIDAAGEAGIELRRATPAETLRWINSAARWAHDNGMRLPKDWICCASILGDVGDWKSADVSAFRKEFAGHPDDLRQRLIGESLESYVKRPDIEFMFDVTAPYMDQKTGRYSDWPDEDELDEEDLEELDKALDEVLLVEEFNALADQLTPAAKALAEETAQWLQAHQKLPSSELFEAWRSMMLAKLMSTQALPDADEDEVADFGNKLLKSFGGRIEESHFEEYHRAVGQALEHLESDSKLIRKAVLKHGLAGALEDEDKGV